MTNHRRRVIALILAAILLLPCLPAVTQAAPEEPVFRCLVGDCEILPQTVGEDLYLFLPSAADMSGLTFRFPGETLLLRTEEGALTAVSGEPIDLTSLFSSTPEDGIFQIEMLLGGTAGTLRIMHSQYIASLFITSDDPDKDLRWVELSKSNKAKGSAVLMEESGTVLYEGALKQIKGRGNSTWEYAKKPYQIKLDQSADLLLTGEPSKTWVLLSNYFDKTLLRNRIGLDLAAEMGMEYTSRCRPVDLYYDGSYRGSYLLTEKVEIDENRVDIHSLEKDYEAANPDIEDFDSLPRIEDTAANGYSCQYIQGLNTPEDLSGGYLLETEYTQRLPEEASWFTTGLDQNLVCKSPEYLSKAGMDYITAVWQNYEDAVSNGGVNPETGASFSEYMDLPSLAKSYLLLELAQEPDAYVSSTYFYKPAGSEKLYAGPLWDFDTSFGESEQVNNPHALLVGKAAIPSRLLELPAFLEEAVRQSQTLDRLVREILLDKETGTQGMILRSLAGYDEEILPSRRMDHVFWSDTDRENGANTTEYLARFFAKREPWLYETIACWPDPATAALAGSRFLDVTAEDWFVEPVKEVSDRGLLQGVGSGLFDPLGEMTRSMVCMVLYRLAGEPETDFAPVFSDVSSENWFSSAVSWAYAREVVAGYPDGSFRPDDTVTRQELVSMLYRYLSGEVPAGGWNLSPFADQESVPDWALPAFGWAANKGLVNGIPDEDGLTRLRPQDPLLRSQAAALLQRLLTMMAEPAPAESSAEAPVGPAPETNLPDAE